MNRDAILEHIRLECNRVGIDIPTVIFRKNMTNAYAYAYLEAWEIGLSSRSITRLNDCIVRSIILHEILHLRNYRDTGSNTHDRNFKDLCAKYGCHSQSLLNGKVRREIIAATRKG